MNRVNSKILMFPARSPAAMHNPSGVIESERIPDDIDEEDEVEDDDGGLSLLLDTSPSRSV